jgi:Ca-activated chloride channel family protein
VAVEVTGVTAGVVILEQVATTTLDISLRNTTGSRQEAELVVPVPEGSAVRGFAFHGAAKEPTAEVLPKDDARRIYDSIVAKVRDPALLEFVGYNLIRSSVFPLEAGATQKVRLTNENLLEADGDRIDYVLPRTESLQYTVPWKVSMRIRSRHGIATTYSPSHQTVMTRRGPGEVRVVMAAESSTEPGPFMLSYLARAGGKAGAEDSDVSATLLAYPDVAKGGGYFLLLAASPPAADRALVRKTIDREVTIVIDRSGSMSGEKIEQARAAALQIVNGLRYGEPFNIIDYADSISSFAPSPVVKTRENIDGAARYLRRLTPGGGTNLHDALVEALRQKPTEGMLPLVLFMTDGLPTVGVRNEVSIRTAAIEANQHKRRIFSFGVGFDVNAPLLTHIARKSRAVSTFVLPKEDVEVKVSQVYKRLSGPVLAGPALETLDADGRVTTSRVRDLMPRVLPDMFEGDRLVVLGRYVGDEPLAFRVRGDYRGTPRTFRFDFKLDGATTRNGFVPRLWASRKIAFLIDEIRQAGAEDGARPSTLSRSVLSRNTMTDPHMKELVDEIVRLSTEFGILTEYTAFLAREGTDLGLRDDILREANGNLRMRAQLDRQGRLGFNQAVNNDFQQEQWADNRRNWHYDKNMRRVEISNVQQMNGRAFFQRGERWIDSRVINGGSMDQVDETVRIGSEAHRRLVDNLAKQNRNGDLSLGGEVLLRVQERNVLVTK